MTQTPSSPAEVQDSGLQTRAVAQARVQFVGTGPGDPGLLTLSAVTAINRASRIIIDSERLRALLQTPEIQLNAEAEIIEPDTPQDIIAALLDAAGHGLDVVRLVEGDPFLDGDIGAECSALAIADHDVDVVPGVSPLTAVPEYAGVSLHGHDVQLIGVESARRDLSSEGYPWAAEGLIVVSTIVDLVREVVAHALESGRGESEPAVITLHGGTTEQVSTTTTLGGLAAAVAKTDPAEPAYIVIGHVVAESSRARLDWYESKPLFGWSILIPRTRDHSATLPSRLQDYGARCLDVPTISMELPRTPQQMDKAIRGMVEGRYEWVVFTSANAVRAVREKLESIGLDSRAYSGLRIAAIFDSTVKALAEWGVRPDLVPEGTQSTAALAATFPAFDDALDPINRVFVPRADIATESLSAELSALGWEVEDIIGYRTVRAAPPPAETREAIRAGRFDAVVFTSSTTVRNLVGIAGKPHRHTVVAAIGQRTAETCEEHGLAVDVVAPEPTPTALADSLAAFAAARRDDLIAKGRPVIRPSQRKRRGRQPGH
ncbi:uroporphyrinogen-III synthase [Acidipropionibacterium jensenii]|uniref:Uroporphyrinogen-III C-methyltransferase n=1 Tax=Acidipropionibacterium jensenii TaxID=1749 RepID=A0A3S4YY69_9ACTN|nr:uroporphyrinogen-III synthase [Acidipropionibacterium jensenii]MDN6556164.1 uroporphyrinogen-III synthase [Acidipropionibacterium acidipropionici]MDN5976402.1 uroporphyrinogen-III synthase [Acidipropionibacterium jensenii]MDN5996152.1 uroporphyrinogen-III synthase [Acidipropionibacterium jensenii]MDN6426243.1 uroporphyrinogen-III synthase [Acidipropionibacterium jensenii]MDN6441717.1 uroporphyrinogen-III synthase [Acidipropionibacterium jensenii]